MSKVKLNKKTKIGLIIGSIVCVIILLVMGGQYVMRKKAEDYILREARVGLKIYFEKYYNDVDPNSLKLRIEYMQGMTNEPIIKEEEAHKANGSFIWTTELYQTGVKIYRLNGTHDVFTLVGYDGKIASLQGAQDMVDYGHKGQTNCQWFYGNYEGGQNQPAGSPDDWQYVMGETISIIH